MGNETCHLKQKTLFGKMQNTHIFLLSLVICVGIYMYFFTVLQLENPSLYRAQQGSISSPALWSTYFSWPCLSYYLKVIENIKAPRKKHYHPRRTHPASVTGLP